MKKLLFLLGMFTFTSFITMNETSCFCNRNKEKPYDRVIHKIENAQNCTLQDDNGNPDTTNSSTKTAILNQIGLTSQEQSYVIDLSGTLQLDVASSITFNISKTANSGVVYQSVTNDVTWHQFNLLNASMNSKIGDANNLTLINNQQFTISNLGFHNSFISDIHLNFTDKIAVTNCQGGPSWINYLNNNLYLTESSCLIGYFYVNNLELDDNGNYYNNSSWSTSTLTAYPIITFVSNNQLYCKDSENNIWELNLTDNKSFTEITNDSTSVHNISNCICNIKNKLYIGTTSGLYESSDNGITWTLNTSLGSSINITNIISSADGKEIFAASATDLYESSDGQTFTSIYKATNLNVNSLFISQNNNLYFGDKDKGLNKIALSDLTTVQSLVSPNISATDNVKSIIQTADGTILVLTNSHVVYLQELQNIKIYIIIKLNN